MLLFLLVGGRRELKTSASQLNLKIFFRIRIKLPLF
jgi:hypothetical protein